MRVSKPKVEAVIRYILKLAIGIIIVSPILFGVAFSFMNPSERVMYPPLLFPKNPVTYTYATALSEVPMVRFMANSFIDCAIVIVGQTITCSFAAYAFSFFKFKGQKLLFFLVLSTMMIPGDAIIIANYLTIAHAQLSDTYTALVLPYLTSAMGIFLMRQFYLTIPKDLHEAATLDGCKNLRFLFQIVMPISKPAIASLGVYTFIQVYNQYFWPLLVTNTNQMRTIQVGIGVLQDAEHVDYGIVIAGAVLSLIPSIIVFIIGQKYLVKGMTAGAVKG
jgi:sn-glycerol 3-phosphate transport system permease protein